MYSDFFTSYEATEAPSIIPSDYVSDIELNKKEQEFNSLDVLPPISSNEDPIFEQEIEFGNYSPSVSNNKINTVVNIARQFLGGKYTWGGSSPNTGFDCSGLIRYVYKQVGINLPRTVKEMEKAGTEVSLNSVKPGDLICLSSGGPSGRHIKMVSKILDGQIWTIDARGQKKGIVEEPLSDFSHILTIRRIMETNDYYHKFGTSSNKFQELVDVMYPIYQEVVSEQGLNSKIIPYLIKQDALESNYGLSPRGNGYNLGGIKGNPSVSTRYSDGQYYRNFTNLKDYATYKVKLLNNRYDAFAATSEQDFINRLHGNNSSGYSYSASADTYSKNFKGLTSLEQALNKYTA